MLGSAPWHIGCMAIDGLPSLQQQAMPLLLLG